MAVAKDKRNRVAEAGPDEARMWNAMLRRDADQDGVFVYAVVSTGVYCRPSCPSRRPLRKNVRFYTLNQDAEAAGFRPCKRCKPTEMSLEQNHALAVEQACRHIEQADGSVRLDDLAEAARLSSYHFHRIFKAHTGVTPKAYEKAVRGTRVSETLAGARTVTDAAYDAGLSSGARLYDDKGARLGMSATAYRKGGEGRMIEYAFAKTVVGLMIVAASDKGVCAIFFGDSEARLERDLRTRFPNAEIEPSNGRFKGWVTQAVAYLKEPKGALELPLDVRGSAFQERVWAELKKMPAGELASYADIAKRLGKPNAVRAVAGACARNPVAIAIPCHRIVRSDGSISGYRWGPERKRALLKREAVLDDD